MDREKTTLPEARIAAIQAEELPWQESKVAHVHEGWRTLRVVLCTAIVFAFFAYLSYLAQGQ